MIYFIGQKSRLVIRLIMGCWRFESRKMNGVTSVFA